VVARRNARHAAFFSFVAAITALQSLLFETFGRSLPAALRSASPHWRLHDARHASRS
jgi:hypothetical protein